MPRYRCVNDTCSMQLREILVHKVKMVYNKWKDVMEPSPLIICEECGKELEYVKQEGPITCHFNAFHSMTPQQKREVMHKRSQDHFKKHDKGDLNNYKKSITDNLRRQAEGRS